MTEGAEARQRFRRTRRTRSARSSRARAPCCRNRSKENEKPKTGDERAAGGRWAGAHQPLPPGVGTPVGEGDRTTAGIDGHGLVRRARQAAARRLSEGRAAATDFPDIGAALAGKVAPAHEHRAARDRHGGGRERRRARHHGRRAQDGARETSRRRAEGPRHQQREGHRVAWRRPARRRWTPSRARAS